MSLCVATMREAPSGVDVGKVAVLNGHPGPGDIPLATANASSFPQVYVKYNTPESNAGVVGSYQLLYEASPDEILCYSHDDVIIREREWDARLLKEFEDPSVGIVGFGGALWHGTPDLYKVPYNLQNLRRGEYLSNVDDAEVHGQRFDGAADAAVLDGYLLAVRRRLLDRCGGFNPLLGNCDFFCYDYALCALARRFGYRIRVLGVRCHHRGGGTSVGEAAKEITSQEAYDRSHRWFYDEFRDVLPYDVRK